MESRGTAHFSSFNRQMLRLRKVLPHILAWLAIASSNALAQTREPSVASSSTADLTPREAEVDFDLLRKALEEAHGGLYRFSTKMEVDRRFDEFRTRLNVSISRREFIAFISEVVADARDGHARLEYDDTTNAALTNARLLPLRVALERRRIVVVFNDTRSDSTIRPGMEVVSINGRFVSAIVATILPKISGDGFIESGKRAQLARGFARYYWLFVDSSSMYTIVLRTASGGTVTTTVPGVINSERERNNNPVNAQIRNALARLVPPGPNVSLTFQSNSAIAHLRIRSFGGPAFKAELDSAFSAIREKQTKALILDLRGNGGGVDEFGAYLVSHLTPRPFRYFDRIHLTTIHPSFATWKASTFDDLRAGTHPDPNGGYLVTARLHPGVTEQQPVDRPFTGGLFVLMDGATFSTSADVTAVLHDMKRATFIGEETGGTYEGNTSGLNALIVLPNSRLRLKIMMYQYWNAVKAPVRGRGTLPDYPVELRVADILRNLDAPLQRAETLAGKKP